MVVGAGNANSPYTVNGEITLVPVSGGFIRGDDNASGAVDLADPIYGLNYLFLQGPQICLDAMDANDDGVVDTADPTYNLTYLFSSGPPMPAPFPDCGPDPTEEPMELGCDGPVPSCP